MSSTETWLKIKVVLVSGRGEELDPPPGRVMLASENHTLAQFAESIDLAFARWDISHLHLFTLPDGLALMSQDEIEDSHGVGATTANSRLGRIGLESGSQFQYVFDLGDEWTHDCQVIEVEVDPIEEFGAPPEGPVPIDGWGWIPDQYGRDAEVLDDE
jgi:Plasmid pRiA4b ORF-3-like protein